jgi:hypothetical protein
MFTIKDHNSRYLFDPWQYLGDKRRKMLDQSWAGIFQQHILTELPVEKIAHFFHERMGRPSKELTTVIGTLLLQQYHDLTDEQAVEQLAFNIQWHYALNIPEESEQLKYICPKTLWSMRQRMIESDIDLAVFEKICSKLADVFEVDTRLQRIDSVHVHSNMRRLGRISIFAQTIHKFLVNLRRHHRDLFQAVPVPIRQRYFKRDALSCFAKVKPSDAAKTLKQVSKDLFELVQQFGGHSAVSSMHSYKLMARVLDEQCSVSENGRDVSVKPSKQIGSDSLQNPSDPDAAYSSKKGQGYQVQVMETYSTTADAKQKAQQLDLITYVKVEKASKSDTKALIPAIDDTQKRELAPRQVTGDALYGSDGNFQQAKQKSVSLVAPTLGAEFSAKMGLSAFVFAQNSKTLSCPAGHAPLMNKKKKIRFTAGFCADTCAQCPMVDSCPVRPGKHYYYLHYEQKAARVARRRRKEQSTSFIEKYRWRAGVEATMSQYDRRTGVKHQRYRGEEKIRFAAVLKAAGLNILRAAAVMRARWAAQKDVAPALNSPIQASIRVKERLILTKYHICRIFRSLMVDADQYGLKTAA